MTTSLPEDRRRALVSLGTAITPAMIDGTARLMAPHARRPDHAICTVVRDIAYGPHDRHRLDIFAPLAATCHAVVVYVHGGGFITGDKGGEGAPFYNNVGAWAAASGFVGVTINYRLAPDAQWPAGSEDLASAVTWLRRNAGDYGGDTTRIFVMGQSAGAAHVAGYLAHPDMSAQTEIAGAIMLSGLYDLLSLDHSPMELAYYGPDERRFATQSSLPYLARTALPCLYSVAEFDPPVFQLQAAGIVREYAARTGTYPRMLFLPGHNHLSPVMAIGTEGDYLSEQLRAFVDNRS